MNRCAFRRESSVEALTAAALMLCACVVPGASAAPAGEMPRTEAGRYAAAYFRAFNSGNPDTMLAFCENAYSFAYLETTPPGRRASDFRRLLDAFGSLEPLRVTRSLDRQLTLLVDPEKGGRALVMRFQLEMEPPHRLAYVSIGGVDGADVSDECAERVASRSAPVDGLLRAGAVKGVAEALRNEYVSRALGAQMADTLLRNLAIGRYDVALKAGKLADLLTEDARAVSKDDRIWIEARNPMDAEPSGAVGAGPAHPSKEIIVNDCFRVSMPRARGNTAR